MRGFCLETKQMRFNIIRHLFIALALLLSSLTSALALEETSIQLRWDHQFQFAGYYAAKWEGFYADAGFDVDIRSAVTPDGRILQAVEEVAEGRADFGVGAADILIARDRGAPLVVLASIFQRSGAEFYAMEDTPLQSPRDLLNLRVARNVNDLIDIELQAMLLAEGVDPEKITPYPHRPSYKPFMEGLVDVIPGYRITVPYAFQKKGISYKTLRPINYGVDFYGDSLFSRQEMIDDPDKVRRFIQATVKGWRFAMDNAIQVADRIARDHPRSFGAAQDSFQEFNRFQIPGVKELMFYPIAEIGHINPHRWRRMHDFMKGIGIIKGDLDVAALVFDFERIKASRRDAFLRLIKLTLLVLGVLFACFVAWNASLRKMVARQTDELSKSKQVLEEAQSIARMGSFHWTFDTGRVNYSQEVLDMYGIDAADFDGKIETFLETAIHPQDREKVRRVNEFVMKTDKPAPVIEFRILDKDGNIKYVLARGGRYRDKDGNAVGMIGVAQDITDVKLAGENLKRTAALLQNIIDNSMSLIIAKDLDGKYILANRLSEQMINYSKGEMLGKTDEEIFTPDMAANIRKMDREVLESGEPLIIEETFLLKGRPHTYHTNKFPLFDDAGAPFAICGMAADITERKAAQQQLQAYSERLEEMVAERTRELEKAQAELLVKERLAVLGNLSGSISHEIRNPLGAIGASIYFLRMKMGGGDEKIQAHLERIQANVDQATAIIESLLNLTRMERPRTEPHDLNTLVPEIFQDAGVPEGVDISVRHPETATMADVDAAQFRIMLKNLIQNASQAMEGTGVLTATIEQSGNGRAQIALSDTGPGIPAEHLEKIFQPLFSTKTHGIGFGLSIAKMIVEKHGGTIRAESPPEGGARFVICFNQNKSTRDERKERKTR